MKILNVNYLFVKAGSEANAFWNGKKQNSVAAPDGFNFKRITWFGDSHADQKAIWNGYFSK